MLVRPGKREGLLASVVRHIHQHSYLETVRSFFKNKSQNINKHVIHTLKTKQESREWLCLRALVAFPEGNPTTSFAGLCGSCMHMLCRHTGRQNIHTHKTKRKVKNIFKHVNTTITTEFSILRTCHISKGNEISLLETDLQGPVGWQSR